MFIATSGRIFWRLKKRSHPDYQFQSEGGVKITGTAKILLLLSLFCPAVRYNLVLNSFKDLPPHTPDQLHRTPARDCFLSALLWRDLFRRTGRLKHAPARRHDLCLLFLKAFRLFIN
jgi:hypothetical protein